MAVHLYGVVDTVAVPEAPALRGIDGRIVRALPLVSMSAWVTDLPEPRFEATAARLREHDAVLRGAVKAGYSVVPSLFGRNHEDESTLLAALKRSADAVDTAMSLVRGRVEMSLLVAASGASSAPLEGEVLEHVGPGREHLRRIQKQVHAERILRGTAADLAKSASLALSEFFVAERVVESPALPVLMARAHLVSRENVVRYLRAAKSLATAADPALRLAVRGPGAAYSFAAVQVG